MHKSLPLCRTVAGLPTRTKITVLTLSRMVCCCLEQFACTRLLDNCVHSFAPTSRDLLWHNFWDLLDNETNQNTAQKSLLSFSVRLFFHYFLIPATPVSLDQLDTKLASPLGHVLVDGYISLNVV